MLRFSCKNESQIKAQINSTKITVAHTEKLLNQDTDHGSAVAKHALSASTPALHVNPRTLRPKDTTILLYSFPVRYGSFTRI